MINMSTFKSGFHSAIANSQSSSVYRHMAMGGMGGAGLGAINGGLSYDGSVLGGAFNGALGGAILGTGAKFGTALYGTAGKDLTEKMAARGGMGSFATGIFGGGH